jgi:hypothetical protein
MVQSTSNLNPLSSSRGSGFGGITPGMGMGLGVPGKSSFGSRVNN